MRVGDKVIIKNAGGIYSQYEEMAIKMGLKNWDSGRRSMNFLVDMQNEIGIVKKIEKHPKFKETCVGIRLKDGYDYIINKKSLDVINKRCYINIPDEMFEI